jgi:hypothetical protein
LCGFAFGLAILSKHVASIYCVGPLVVVSVWAIGQTRDPAVWRRSMADLIGFGIGTAVPLLAFEAWKLSVIGWSAWLENWREFGGFIRSQGIASRSTDGISALLAERTTALSDRFVITPGLSVMILCGLAASLRFLDERQRFFYACLFVGLLAHAVYWIFFSTGWPRYFYIGVVVWCFLFAFAIAVITSNALRLGLISCCALLLVNGLPRLQYQWQLSAEARTTGQSDISSAQQIMKSINQFHSPRSVVTQWWAHVATLEYLSDSPGRFHGFSADADPGTVDLVVVNARYLRTEDKSFETLLTRCSDVVAKVPPYTLLRC